MTNATKGLDPDRHYAVMMGGEANEIRVKIGCGSNADVFVGQLNGSVIFELGKEGAVNPTGLGPLYINCAQHGSFLGVWQVLAKAQASDPAGAPVSMPLLLIPLRDIEHLDPLGTGTRIANETPPTPPENSPQ